MTLQEMRRWGQPQTGGYGALVGIEDKVPERINKVKEEPGLKNTFGHKCQ